MPKRIVIGDCYLKNHEMPPAAHNYYSLNIALNIKYLKTVFIDYANFISVSLPARSFAIKFIKFNYHYQQVMNDYGGGGNQFVGSKIYNLFRYSLRSQNRLVNLE